MSPVFYLLLMFGVGRCSKAHIFETKTVGVGENVTLSCERQHSWRQTYMYWIRLVSGEIPQCLGSTISLDMDHNDVFQRRFTAKQEPGAFVLHITETQLTDTAIYYCIKVQRRSMEFLSGIFLRIKGPQPNLLAVYQDPLLDPVHPGDAVTLHCSVLFSSEGKSCPTGRHVYWFNAGADESPPNLIYTQKNRGDECEQSPEVGSLQKCFYSFSKNVSSSDAGTYICAVAACGEIMIGNGTRLEIEDVQTCDVQTVDVTVFIILCGALVLSLIIIAFLLYYIKKQNCEKTTAAVKQETNTVSTTGFIQQRFEDSVVYYTPKISSRRPGKAGRVHRNPPEKESVYSNVRIH